MPIKTVLQALTLLLAKPSFLARETIILWPVPNCHHNSLFLLRCILEQMRDKERAEDFANVFRD